MRFPVKYSGLYTDHYELTMAQAYFLSKKMDTVANFDYFFRKAPFKGSYVVFAGLSELLEAIQKLRFEKEDLEFLASLGFRKEFLDYLRHFSFSGKIYSVQEGEVVFPNEPVLRTEGNIIETQLIETLVLNILNFESLIATKASRMRLVAGDKTLIDFGLRRAQGLGGIQASKAAMMGGFDSTSNVYSAFLFNLTTSGTQAHSFIQSYEDELSAFQAFSSIYPDKCILLVDTYNTLHMGVPNAIQVAKKMEQRGQKLYGIRIDSGDLAYLSKQARQMLNDAGLHYVKIIASNQLDEYAIRSLQKQNIPIDAFGVGTSLVTGKTDAALDGIYKLTMADYKPKLKLSEEPEKIIIPGIKKIYRYIDKEGKFYADGIVLNDEENISDIYEIKNSNHCLPVQLFSKTEICHKVYDGENILITNNTLSEIRKFAENRLNQLKDEFKRFENPPVYKIGVSKKLLKLRSDLIQKIKRDESLVSSRCTK